MVKPRVIETDKNVPNFVNAQNNNRIIKKSLSKAYLIKDAIIKFGIHGGSVLEIGSGPGYLGLEWLKETKDTKLVGLDMNAEMVKIAEKNAAEYDVIERVKYIVNITRAIPLEDNSFDAVFSDISLHEWAEPSIMFNEIQRVLKPGGRYFISDFRRDITPLNKLYFKIINLKERRSCLISSINSAYTAKEIKQILFKSKLCGSKIAVNPFNLIITGIKPSIVQLKKPIQVIGLSIKTSTKNVGKDKAKIIKKYRQQSIASKISNKIFPEVFIAIAKDYQPETKSFIYEIGEAVTTLSEIPEKLIGFEIPAHKYAVFTVRAENSYHLPKAVMEMRKYIFNDWFPNCYFELEPLVNEFELRDARSKQEQYPEIDIYVAIK